MLKPQEALELFQEHLDAIKYHMETDGVYSLNGGFLGQVILNGLQEALDCLKREIESDLAP
jgi:hypothetical protein